jgi:hypothetical protein
MAASSGVEDIDTPVLSPGLSIQNHSKNIAHKTDKNYAVLSRSMVIVNDLHSLVKP